MGQLVELARQMYEHAVALEKQLEAASAPLPSLASGGPALYPAPSTHPDIFTSREALVEASKQMLQLALGPGDALRAMIGQEKSAAFAMYTIAWLDVCKHVPSSPDSIDVEELARKISVDAGLLGRLLRFAASVNVFTVQNDCVAHTALSETLPSLSAWIKLQGRKETSCALSAWPQAFANYKPPCQPRSMIPWNVGNDTDTLFFDFLRAEPNGMTNFGAAMREHTAVVGSDTSYIVDGFDWGQLGAGPVVDVGGGNGHVSLMLAERFPELQFVVQDVASSEESAVAQIANRGLQDRVRFEVQDFYKPQVVDHGAKVFLIKSILHDWGDDECVDILRGVLPAVEKGAKIVVCDRILPDKGRKPTYMDSFVLMLDLMMFTFSGGKERSMDQWEALVMRTHTELKILNVHQPVGSELGLFVVGF